MSDHLRGIFYGVVPEEREHFGGEPVNPRLASESYSSKTSCEVTVIHALLTPTPSQCIAGPWTENSLLVQSNEIVPARLKYGSTFVSPSWDCYRIILNIVCLQ